MILASLDFQGKRENLANRIPYFNIARSVIYPMDHQQWAWQGIKLWQSVDIEACIPEPGLELMGEGNSFRTFDMCLRSHSRDCNFSIDHNEHAETILA